MTDFDHEVYKADVACVCGCGDCSECSGDCIEQYISTGNLCPTGKCLGERASNDRA